MFAPNNFSLYLRLLFLHLFLLLITACERSLEPSKYDDSGNVGRILSTSIDNVKLGSSLDDVMLLLGNADITGIACGATSSFYIYEYTNGIHAGIRIFFTEIIEQPENRCGPVAIITVTENYSGKTPEGLGIGSTMLEVRKIYNNPVSSVERNDSKDEVYAFKTSYMTFSYEKNKVKSITIQNQNYD